MHVESALAVLQVGLGKRIEQRQRPRLVGRPRQQSLDPLQRAEWILFLVNLLLQQRLCLGVMAARHQQRRVGLFRLR